jgi:hypothetical protein
VAFITNELSYETFNIFLFLLICIEDLGTRVKRDIIYLHSIIGLFSPNRNSFSLEVFYGC